MKLKIELTSGPQAGAQREIDGTVPFSIGTKASDSWYLGGLPQEARITIRRDASGFVLEPEGAVLVEDQPVREAQMLRVGQGSRISLGEAQLRAIVCQDEVASGVGGSFARPVQPTISAILSDVAPGGETASGPLPGREGEAWLQSLTQTAPKPTPGTPVIAPYGQDTQSPANALLPNDWNTPATDSNEVFQAPAPTLAVAVGQEGRAHAAPAQSAGPTARALLTATGLTAQDVATVNDTTIATNAGKALGILLDAVVEFERSQQAFCRELDLPCTISGTPVHPGSLLADKDGLALSALQGRLQEAMERQAALLGGVFDALAHARETLDPAAIETFSSTSAGLSGRFRRSAQAWKEYRSRWGDSDLGPLASKTIAKGVRARGPVEFEGESAK